MWISPKDLATLAGVSYRAAAQAISQAHREQKDWRGQSLVTREVPTSRGGAAGSAYQVALESLPAGIRALWVRDRAQHPAPIAERAAATPWTQDVREAYHAAFARLPTKTQQAARKRVAIISEFFDDGAIGVPVRKRLSAVAARHGVNARTLQRWLNACEGLAPGDWMVALAPRHPGNPSRAPISRDALEFIKAEYFQLTKPALHPIYRRVAAAAKERNWVLPSYETVKRLVKAEPHWMHVLQREGRERFERMYPPQERDYSTLALHQIWCADGRRADLFARWEDGTISRPWVVAWIDLRSRVLVGYTIAKVESSDAARISFRNAVEETRALPESALMDNGRAFAGKLMTGGAPTRYRGKIKDEDLPGILVLLGVKVRWATPRRGRAKPIESFFRHLSEMDKRFPGAYCGNRPGARPEDCDRDKAVPIAEFRKVLAETIDAYNRKPHRGDAMAGSSPREVYEALLASTTVRQPTREQLRLCMMAAEQVKLDPQDHSVRILRNRYWEPRLASLPPGALYTARFNPENAGEPIALYRGDQFICDVPMRDRSGFDSQEAARDHARANRQFQRASIEQAEAIKGMARARRWKTAASDLPQSPLPSPKVVMPVRPTLDYRPDREKRGELSMEVFSRAANAGSRSK